MEPEIGNWVNKYVFHGTSMKHAEYIKQFGIRISKSYKGYFGLAFYVTPEFAHAWGYAAMSDDGTKAIVVTQIASNANILDLRDSKDWEKFQPHSEYVGRNDFNLIMRSAGIDGIYDRAVGGLAIYNPRILTIIGILKKDK